MPEYRLEMEHISKSFPGVKALDDVSLKVKPGSVHALMGENGAGKSTLMKCLFGMYIPNGGTIRLNGREVALSDTRDALQNGIAMIHQELSPIPLRPIMENIWLGRFPKKGPVVDHKKMEEMTAALFESLDIRISPTVLARDLSVSKLQQAEIAKAVSYNAEIIIMDEPTSSLTDTETEHLFRIIRQLKAENRSVIFISHKIDEILTICDEITIMRDGAYQGTWSCEGMTTDFIVNTMVGRTLSSRFPEKHYAPRDEEVLRVENYTSGDRMSFQNVSFTLRRGEILGIGGLVGAQRTELVESIFGLRPIESGALYKNGAKITVRSPRDAKRNGIVLLTEERRKNGIFGGLSVLDNIVVANQHSYGRGPIRVIDTKRRRREGGEYCKELNVRTPGIEALARNLSGGNQQKMLLARWLLVDPDILILDEPTRGIDVGAKYEIYVIMHRLAEQGKSIIMISSEMPELLGMSDRVMVMCAGRMTGMLERAEASQVSVMRLATAFENEMRMEDMKE